jgi:hypothetical protein
MNDSLLVYRFVEKFVLPSILLISLYYDFTSYGRTGSFLAGLPHLFKVSLSLFLIYFAGTPKKSSSKILHFALIKPHIQPGTAAKIALPLNYISCYDL